MAVSYRMLYEIREDASAKDKAISNLKVLGLPADAKALRILWMYPDVLNVFGSRGDLMAIMRMSCAMGIPAAIGRVDYLSEEIDFDAADIIYYPAGDLSCMETIMKRNLEIADNFRAFAERGGTIIAVSSSGVILADEYIKTDGSAVQGLGLLHMTMTERKKVHGDDLWIRLGSGMELIGNQIQLVDTTLSEGQEAFAEVIYGRGNNGTGTEGAAKGNVIYTACLGPMLVRNPWFAAEILKNAAAAAGIIDDVDSLSIPGEEIEEERASFEDAKEFIKNKM